MEQRKVVITGVGIASPIGIGREAFSEGLKSGRCGIQAVTGFDAEGLPSSLAAEVADLRIEEYLRSAKNYLDRNSELAFAACELAIRDAALEVSVTNPDRLALCFGSQWGNIQTMAAFAAKLREKGPRLAPPFLFPHTYPNTTPSLLSIEYGIKGYNEVFFGSALSGAMAVAAAAREVRRGGADVALAGGVDALCAELYRGYVLSGLVSPSRGTGAEGCRPFADEANGPVLGEAGAFVTLEEREGCLSRGGVALATIAAESMNGSLAEAICATLDKARMTSKDLAAVYSGANGDPERDARELSELRGALGDSPPRLIALKSQVGECMAAFGPLSLAAAALSVSAEGGNRLVCTADETGQAVCFLVLGHRSDDTCKPPLMLGYL